MKKNIFLFSTLVQESDIPLFVIDEVLDGLKSHKVENDLTGRSWNDYLFTTTKKHDCIISYLKLNNLKTAIQLGVKEFANNYESLKHREFVLLESWINFNYKHSFQNIHHHTMDGISGVVYIQCKGNSEEGNIVFNGPLHLTHLHSDFEYIPTVGKMLIFHSSSPHCVRYNKLDSTRISLSFNFVDKKLW